MKSRVLALAVLAALAAPAYAQPTMRVGRVFRDAGEELSMGGKGQAKVAFVDGAWWGAFSSANGVDLFRLQGNTWVQESFAGSHVTSDPNSRADVLWDGRDLLVLVNERVGGANALRLYAYQYVRPSFRLRGGFPVTVVAGTSSDPLQSEVHTIAEDTRGRLWVAYRAGQSGAVKASTGTGPSGWTTWRPRVEIGYLGNGVSDTGSVNAIVAWDGKVGVVWSDQSAPPQNGYKFRWRSDSSSNFTIDGWSPEEVAYSAPDEVVANDQVHVVGFEGKVYVMAKTDTIPSASNVGKDRFILLVRDAAGVWTKTTVRRIERSGDAATRAQLAIDGEHRKIYAFWHDIGIEGKVVDLDNPNFLGSPLFSFVAPNSTTNWNSQTTHQIVDSRTDLLIVADDNNTGWQYWNLISLGNPGAGLVEPVISSVTVSPQIASIGTRQTQQFTAAGRDQRNNPIAIVPGWTANGGSIGSDGLYTAGGITGVYGVAATDSETGHATVYVGDVPFLASIVVTPSPVTIRVNETLQLTATGRGPNGETIALSPTQITWSVVDGVGSVTSMGLYQAPATENRAHVEATVGTLSGFATILVFPAPPTGGGGNNGGTGNGGNNNNGGATGNLAKIVITPENPTVIASGTITFVAQGRDAQGNPVAIQPTWSATGGTISETGIYLAGNVPGSYTVSATANGVTETTTVAITPQPTGFVGGGGGGGGGCALGGEGNDARALLPLLVVGLLIGRRRLG